jgi:probable H4MPT-linked C1 transfer pathway protein
MMSSRAIGSKPDRAATLPAAPKGRKPEIGAILGLDVGGAHLKAALVEGGRVEQVVQLACPLWLGVAHLERALAEVRGTFGRAQACAATMTGELADIFPDRAAGVRAIGAVLATELPDVELAIYAGPAGLLRADEAVERPLEVASANWHATAALVARRVGDALLVDVGSTTTDLIPIAAGAVCTVGYTDRDRLAAGELVYTGVSRTPLMALAQSVPFDGRHVPLAAELFATTADIYRLLQILPEHADILPAADQGEKTEDASARRLARMLGTDAPEASPAAWRALAAVFAEAQMRSIEDAARLALSRGLVTDTAPIVGAGVGRFVTRRLAQRLERPWRDFAELVQAVPDVAARAADCAPAAAVGLLLAGD